MSAPGAPHARARDGLLRWIAAERSLRATPLFELGLQLVERGAMRFDLMFEIAA